MLGICSNTFPMLLLSRVSFYKSNNTECLVEERLQPQKAFGIYRISINCTPSNHFPKRLTQTINPILNPHQ